MCPGYHTMLGMHAFGLEEMGDYAAAEKSGRQAVEIEARDSWAQHAVAHVMEMQGRQKEGIAWMEGNTDGWSRENFLADPQLVAPRALSPRTRRHRQGAGAVRRPDLRQQLAGLILELIDASAMLWRLHLRGIDVGDRWDTVADAWEPVADAGIYAFNDAHAMMAFVGAGRRASAQRVIEAQTAAMMAESADNAAFTREVGHPVALAIQNFGDGNYAETVRQLRGVRNIAHRFGGSHAQRDVLDLTMIEAAFRAGQHALAKALVGRTRGGEAEQPAGAAVREARRGDEASGVTKASEETASEGRSKCLNFRTFRRWHATGVPARS